MAEKRKPMTLRDAWELEKRFSVDVGRPTGAGTRAVESGIRGDGHSIQAEAAALLNFREETTDKSEEFLADMRQIETEARLNAKGASFAKSQISRRRHHVRRDAGKLKSAT